MACVTWNGFSSATVSVGGNAVDESLDVLAIPRVGARCLVPADPVEEVVEHLATAWASPVGGGATGGSSGSRASSARDRADTPRPCRERGGPASCRSGRSNSARSSRQNGWGAFAASAPSVGGQSGRAISAAKLCHRLRGNSRLAVSPYPVSVGARGFEPPTSRSRTVRSSQAELRPEKNSAHPGFQAVMSERLLGGYNPSSSASFLVSMHARALKIASSRTDGEHPGPDRRRQVLRDGPTTALARGGHLPSLLLALGYQERAGRHPTGPAALPMPQLSGDSSTTSPGRSSPATTSR